MKIYNDYMHDIIIIMLYEFVNLFNPLIINIFSYYLYKLSSLLNQYFYIPKTNKLDLKNVVIVFDSKIIYCNLLNMNYYHIKIKYNNSYISIRGNKNYIIYNDVFTKYKNTPYFSIYELPIKKYDQEECCVCYSEKGNLNGLCGHQIVCLNCSKHLNKCPVCNSSFIKNSDFLEKILYI